MPVKVLLGRDGRGIARPWVVASMSAWVFAVFVACGDDSGKSASDASVDSGPVAGNGTTIPTRPRMDAAVLGTDPLTPCDRYDPTACPSNQTCDVVVRLFPGDTQLTLYAACVDKAVERGLNDPCDSGFTSGEPYSKPGLNDPVYRDQCGPGLICGADQTVRGGTACRPVCQSGRFNDQPVACESPKDFCIGGAAFQEFCRTSEGCDVFTQTGCPAGQACYLRPRDDGAGIISLCFPPADMPLADGTACDSYNACRPGASCVGPMEKDPREWVLEDLACRSACNADGTNAAGEGTDAGQDDGGLGGGGKCAAPQRCRPFAPTGLDLTTIDNPPYGLCE